MIFSLILNRFLTAVVLVICLTDDQIIVKPSNSRLVQHQIQNEHSSSSTRLAGRRSSHIFVKAFPIVKLIRREINQVQFAEQSRPQQQLTLDSNHKKYRNSKYSDTAIDHMGFLDRGLIELQGEFKTHVEEPAQRVNEFIGRNAGDAVGAITSTGYKVAEKMDTSLLGDEEGARELERQRLRVVPRVRDETEQFSKGALASGVGLGVGALLANPYIIGASVVGIGNAGYQVHLEREAEDGEITEDQFKQDSRIASGVTAAVTLASGVKGLSEIAEAVGSVSSSSSSAAAANEAALLAETGMAVKGLETMGYAADQTISAIDDNENIRQAWSPEVSGV